MMKEKNSTQLSIEKELLIHLNELFHSRSALNDLEEHTSINRKRKAVRIYLEHPVKITITDSNGRESAIEGRSVNVCECGILVNALMETSYWEQLESQIKEASLTYEFAKHEQLSGEIIDGKVCRYSRKSGEKNKDTTIEMGIQVSSRGIKNKYNLLQYINNRIIESIDKDITHIEKIRETRKLTEEEEKIYKLLLTEYSDRK